MHTILDTPEENSIFLGRREGKLPSGTACLCCFAFLKICLFVFIKQTSRVKKCAGHRFMLQIPKLKMGFRWEKSFNHRDIPSVIRNSRISKEERLRGSK